MRVIATLLVRDEEEIVEECIRHHLAHGVDAFIVTDNGSKDRTREIVASCPNVLEIIDEPTHNHHQSKWVNRMARHAWRQGAHWVVHLDADEFWYGLERLHNPKNFKGKKVIVVKNECCHVPVEGLEFGKFRRDQMPYYKKVKNPMPKVIHRAAEHISISHGNHMVLKIAGIRQPDEELKPTLDDVTQTLDCCEIITPPPPVLRIHHYPVRSYEHFRTKTVKGGTALKRHPGPSANGKRWRNWFKAYRDGELPRIYGEKVVTAVEVPELLADGTLKVFIPQEYRSAPSDSRTD